MSDKWNEDPLTVINKHTANETQYLYIKFTTGSKPITVLDGYRQQYI